jgi:hypothetical protein
LGSLKWIALLYYTNAETWQGESQKGSGSVQAGSLTSFGCQIICRVIFERSARNLYYSFKNPGKRDFSHFKQSLFDCVIPAWSAGIQINMDVSGSIPATWMPAIRAGMTRITIFMFCGRA